MMMIRFRVCDLEVGRQLGILRPFNLCGYSRVKCDLQLTSHGTVILSISNRRSSEIQGTALGKSLRALTCISRSMPAGVAQSSHAFVGGTVSTWAR